MKKIITILLCLLLVCIAAIPASAAAPSLSLSASATTVNRDGTVTVTVNASGGAAAKAGGIELSYDTSAFQLVSGQWSLNGAIIANFNTGDKTGAFTLDSAKVLSGKIFTFTLKVKSGASFSSKGITVKLTVKDQGSSSGTVNVTVACKHSFGSWSKVNSSSHSHSCTICGKSETASHYYDNDCDTKCNGCGHTRSITHQYEEAWSGDEEGHFHKCAVCGDRKDEAPHIPGAEATVAAPQTCTECQYIITPSLEHDHILQDELQSDATGHWKVCTLCPNRIEFAEHRFSAECDEDCEDCGFQRETVHTQGTELEADSEHHWYPCTVCGKHMQEQEHIGDLKDSDPICEVCFHAMEHIHNYSNVYYGSLIAHWHQCTCGEKEGSQAHIWTEEQILHYPTILKDGTAVFTCEVCKAENEVRLPALYRSALSLLILCGICAVAFVGMFIALIVIIVKVNKKPKGKFAAKSRKELPEDLH